MDYQTFSKPKNLSLLLIQIDDRILSQKEFVPTHDNILSHAWNIDDGTITIHMKSTIVKVIIIETGAIFTYFKVI